MCLRGRISGNAIARGRDQESPDREIVSDDQALPKNFSRPKRRCEKRYSGSARVFRILPLSRFLASRALSYLDQYEVQKSHRRHARSDEKAMVTLWRSMVKTVRARHGFDAFLLISGAS